MTVSSVKRLDPFAECYDLDDLEPIVIPVKFKGRQYELREALSDDALKWRAAAIAKMVPSEAGNLVPASGFHDNEAHILSLCLWDVTDPAKPTRPTMHWLRANMPYRFLEPLAERAKDISGITTQDDDEQTLEKRIAFLQKRLTELRDKNAKEKALENGEGEGNPEGNGLSNGTPVR